MTEEVVNPSKKNTYIFDSESTAADINRLTLQDRLITQKMGGLLPDTIDPSKIHSVLDIACGPGCWGLDLAYMYKDMNVVGVDINERMIKYTNERKLPNTSFRVMDVRQQLDFPDNTFDFVNGRFLFSFMPKKSWPHLLQECWRITRPGGTVRLTECERIISSTPVFEQLQGMMMQAIFLAGQSFSPSGREIGITSALSGFLHDTGYQNIQYKAFAIDMSFHGDAHTYMYENFQINLLLGQPFLLKTLSISEPELVQLSNQALAEMQSPDFRAIWYNLSVWGSKPS